MFNETYGLQRAAIDGTKPIPPLAEEGGGK